MKRVLPKIVVILVVLTALWCGWRFWNAPEQGGTTSLTLYGNVEIHQVELGFRVGGRVAEMLVTEGQTVRAGEPLARLDPRPYEDELRVAEANVATQEAALAKLQAGYRSEEIEHARAGANEARVFADNARRNFERVQKLRGSGGVSQQTVEDASASYRQAQARLDAALTQLGMMEKGYRHEDITAQKAVLEAAKASAARARTALEDTELRAAAPGIVLSRVREPGSIVQPGQTVYTLTLNKPVYIRAFVTQPQLGLVRPGAAVTVKVDAMPETYPGTVGYISSAAEFAPKSVETQEVRNDLVFRLRVLAEDPDNVMRQGMPVTIELPLTSTSSPSPASRSDTKSGAAAGTAVGTEKAGASS